MSENNILFLANFEKPLSSKTEQMVASDSVLKPKVLFMVFVCLCICGCGCICVWRPVLSVLCEMGSLTEPETCWPASPRDLPVSTSPSLSVSGIGLGLRWVLGVKLRSWCLISKCFTNLPSETLTYLFVWFVFNYWLFTCYYFTWSIYTNLSRISL